MFHLFPTVPLFLCSITCTTVFSFIPKRTVTLSCISVTGTARFSTSRNTYPCKSRRKRSKNEICASYREEAKLKANSRRLTYKLMYLHKHVRTHARTHARTHEHEHEHTIECRSVTSSVCKLFHSTLKTPSRDRNAYIHTYTHMHTHTHT